MNGDFVSFGGETFRQGQAGGGGQLDIENILTSIAIKVAMFPHIGAKAGGSALEHYLAYHAALDQGIEAIIDRRHGDVRHSGFGADKDFFCGRVIALIQQDVIHLLALRSEPEAAGGQPFIQGLNDFFVSNAAH